MIEQKKISSMSDNEILQGMRDIGLCLEPSNSGSTVEDFDETLQSLCDDFEALTPAE